MKKRLLVLALVLLIGAALLGVVLLRGCKKEDPFAPPAPDAPEAPGWTAPKAEPAEDEDEEPVVEDDKDERDSVKEPPEKPSEEPVEEPGEEPVEESDEEIDEAPAYDPHAKYGWPAEFMLPLEITVKDLPEVPEGIKGPSPPIEEE